VHKRKKIDQDTVIVGNTLSLDEWLSLLGTEKRKRVFPSNCFPSDKHKEEYLSRISSIDEMTVKKLSRCFLNKSSYYGVTKDHFLHVIEKNGANKIFNDEFDSEFDRRSMPKNGPQWEGITWVLDLLPDQAGDAIASIRAYMHAHLQYFTDQMIYGHNDVVDIIQARYHVMDKLSCFISFGGPDEAFAQMLCDSLTKKGVQTFFFPRHAVPGKRLHKVMREGVNQYDRVILICSKGSLNRPGVLNELTETLQREAREGGKEYLIPIRLDNYLFKGWDPPDKQLAQTVRDRVVADFRGTKKNENKYNAALTRLITALEQPSPVR